MLGKDDDGSTDCESLWLPFFNNVSEALSLGVSLLYAHRAASISRTS